MSARRTAALLIHEFDLSITPLSPLRNPRTRIARERKSNSYQSGLMKSVEGIFAGGRKERREICVVIKADV